MRRGYAHGPGDSDELAAQLAALTAYGCAELLVEREAGEPARMRLDEYLYNLESGDELVVVRLDVFARTTGKLVAILENLVERGVEVTFLEPEHRTLGPEHTWGALDLLRLLAWHEEVRIAQRFHPEGGKAPNARRYRLDPARAAEALRRFEAGDSLASIARDFGVEARIVSAALGGKRRLGEQYDRDGRTRVRRTRLKEPSFDLIRTAVRNRDDDQG